VKSLEGLEDDLAASFVGLFGEDASAINDTGIDLES